MQKGQFVLKGHICYSLEKDTLCSLEDHYVVCLNGICQGVFKELPDLYKDFLLVDYKDQLIIPGLVDLHVHGPQYGFRGLSLDLELLEWLNLHTFPEEAKYKDLDYAKEAYSIFAEDMKKGAVTRACIFATVHEEATTVLMDFMESTGLKTMVGKVNMDRNAPEYLLEAGAKESAESTIHWLNSITGKFKNTRPILTPRFIPTCSDSLMERLKDIQKEFNLPVQSHLSENQGEVAWVKELCKDAKFYGDAYDRFLLFGGDCKTVMAHCVFSDKEECELIKERGVFIAHCPQSNMNLSSGIAPVRYFLEEGIQVGLGSDIAGGTSESIFRAMTDAIQVSKLRWKLVDDTKLPLTIEEAFYLGTKGGGAFFGKVGSFEKGFEFDAVVIDDSRLKHPQTLTVKERLERVIYLSDDRCVKEKYVAGNMVK